MIPKVLISFLSVDTDAELLAATDAILAGMTGNPSYPTPVPTLAEVGAAKSDFATAVSTAAGGGVQFTATKNAKREILVGQLRNLSAYVQTHCQNDLSKLLSSGFIAQKQRQPAGVLAPPQNLRLRHGDVSGQLKARANPVTNAGSYGWRITTSTAPTDWKDGGTTTAASTTFDHLIPGTIYLVQSRAIGSAGPSDWSDPAMLMVV